MANALYVVLLSWALQESPAAATENQTYLTLLERARLEYSKGHFSQSEAFFTSALRTFPRDDEIARARVLSELGDLYVNEDQLPKAESAYGESLGIFKKA